MADIIEFCSRRTRLTLDDRSMEEQATYLIKIVLDLAQQSQRTYDAVLAYRAEAEAKAKATI